MSTIRLELAEYLKSRGFTPDSLVEVVAETVNPETIYQLIEKAKNLHQPDRLIPPSYRNRRFEQT
jgi:hypothetical protein